MKKVLLLGDSIRLGYQAAVREALKETADVRSGEDNGRFTLYTLRYLHEWAAALECGPETAAVHWNNGLWDACHFLGDEEPLQRLSEYRRNLGRILRNLRVLFPQARIIFALSTPVREPHPRVRNAEIIAMNQAAEAFLTQEGVAINDLHRLVLPDWIMPDGTHLSPEGYAALGAAAAKAIREQLEA
ncbi:MAG TPA: GDSL-type esterase/lipase family protein, partial [Clostridia bacterium]|nr:GDSL-type esterase/lipase family protein [Clostridia bacterium]